MVVLFVILVIALLSFFVTTFRIVPQSEQWVIEQMGQYSQTWDAGFHIKTPIIARIANKVPTRELPLDIPPSPVITKDNVTISVDSFAFYKITDARLFTYGIANFPEAMATLTTSTLRNIIGNLDLEGCLTSRDTINKRITAELDQATDKWGVKVMRVEIKNIVPPRDIQAAMDRQMKADRERRETLIAAEAERGARRQKAESDKETMILAAQAKKETAEMEAEANKLRTIRAAEAEKESRILAAEAEKISRLKRAEAEAEAIRLVGQAKAESIRVLNAAAPTDAVLRLKAYEAFVESSKGEATKIIVPSDIGSIVGLATGLKNALTDSPKDAKPVSLNKV